MFTRKFNKTFYDTHVVASDKKLVTVSDCVCGSRYKLVITDKIVFAHCINKKCKNYHVSKKIIFTDKFKIKVSKKDL